MSALPLALFGRFDHLPPVGYATILPAPSFRVLAGPLEPEERYGTLVVIDHSRTVGGNAYYRVRCDCGRIVEKRGGNLRSGHTTTCGKACTLRHKRIEEAIDGTRYHRV